MRSTIYDEDQGTSFGKWSDPVSKFLYYDSTAAILSLIPYPFGTVGDLGGANGNLKEFLPRSVTVDIDPSKNPDIVDNILTHVGTYDLIVIRYVLHYLKDDEVRQLFDHLATYHHGPVLVVQFTNEANIYAKAWNSKGEGLKIFRFGEHLRDLIPCTYHQIYNVDYMVDESFYNNRLGPGEYMRHRETLRAYYLHAPTTT